MRLFYKRKKVLLTSGVRFNNKTVFDKFIRINKNACVNDSQIGAYTYIGDNTELPNAIIGRFCSIASNVKVVTATHPVSVFVSTSPVFHSTKKQCGDSFVEEDSFNQQKLIDSRSVIIGNDVWIGTNALLIGGISIGDGAVIAAGAVVTKDVPPYAIVGGVPAKIIRYRFNQHKREWLTQDKWWEKTEDWLRNNAQLFSNIDIYIESVKKK